MHLQRLTQRALTCAIVCGVGMSMLASCDRGSLHDSLTYCNYLAAHLTDLAKTPATPADVDAEVTLYTTIKAKAPVAVDRQWQQIASLLSEASRIDVNDAVARQKLTDDTYIAERSMKEISDHAGAVCGLVLPSVGSVTPSSPLPPPPSTPTPKSTPASKSPPVTIDPNAPTFPPAETLPRPGATPPFGTVPPTDTLPVSATAAPGTSG